MRTLSPPPRAFSDPERGTISFGSFEGPLPRIDLDRAPAVTRFLRRKKWVFLALVSEEVWVSLAVVRTGYAGTAFAYALDRRAGALACERVAIGSPTSARVTDDPHAPGTLASFAWGKDRALVELAGGSLSVTARLGALSIDATMNLDRAPPAVSAIASLGPGLASATEKRAPLPLRGHAAAGGARWSLDGGFGAYDYSHGLMPRRTRWRWAFGMASREPLAFNLVDGFVGEGECAAFVGGEVRPLGEPRMTYAEGRPGDPWRLEGEGTSLTFEPAAIHAQHTNLLVVRSRFLQPVGVFRGRIAGIDVDGLPGVVEDQDVVW